MAAILLSRLLATVRDMVISGLFGQGRNTDIYTAAFNLPDLLFYLIAGGVLSSAFLPVFVEYMSGGEKERAWRLFSIVASVMTLVVGGFIVFGEIFARQLVPILAAPGFTGAELDQVAHLTRIILPAQLFFFLGGLMMASLWSHQQFTIPGLGPSVYNLGIIIGGAVAGTQLGPHGIEGLAWGALCGAFVGNFLMQFLMLRRYGLHFKPNLQLRHPDAVRVWKLMIPVIFSLSLPQVDVWVNKWLASFFSGGIVTAVDRANRLMQVPIGIFGQAIAIGFYTTLAAQFARGEMKDFRETLNYGLRAILFISIPSTVLMIVLRVPIIQLLLQHGHFSSTATREVSALLAFYALGIAAWSAQAIVARAFYSLQDTTTPFVVGTVVTVVFVGLNWTLIHVIGYPGLALATTIAATLNVSLLLYYLRRKAGGIGAKRIVVSVLKVLAASLVMGLGAWITLHVLQHRFVITSGTAHLKVVAAIEVLAPLAVGMTLFLILAKLLKIEETATAWNMIKRRFSRSAA